MVWQSHLFKNFSQFVVIHTLKGFVELSKAGYVFLEHFRFFNDPMDVGNLISGSPSFSKSSLNIWKCMFHVLLKSCLENFDFTFLVCEISAIVQEFEYSLALFFFEIEIKTDLFQSCGQCWVFQICWHVECSTFTASSFGFEIVGYDWATSLSLFTSMHWRRKWQPTPVFLPRESQGRQSLVGCRLWGCTESDMTEAT